MVAWGFTFLLRCAYELGLVREPRRRRRTLEIGLPRRRRPGHLRLRYICCLALDAAWTQRMRFFVSQVRFALSEHGAQILRDLLPERRRQIERILLQREKVFVSAWFFTTESGSMDEADSEASFSRSPSCKNRSARATRSLFSVLASCSRRDWYHDCTPHARASLNRALLASCCPSSRSDCDAYETCQLKPVYAQTLVQKRALSLM